MELSMEKVKVKPEDLKLKEIRGSVSRDSGCFTGSPLSTTGSSSATNFDSPGSRFDFTPGHSTPYQKNISSRVESGPSSSPAQGSCMSYPIALDDDSITDENDDVFHMSNDFLDSGIHESSRTHTSQICSEEAVYLYGQSRFYLHSTDRVITGHVSRNDPGEDSSTEEEFGTAEFEVVDGESHTSSPISIPHRAQNTQTDDDDDEIDGIGMSTHRFRGGDGQHDDEIVQFRPHSLPYRQIADGRTHSVSDDRFAQSEMHQLSYTSGINGPLPDVVQHTMIRGRAFSESSIFGSQMAQHVGTNLRIMCDQFSETHYHRRQSINMLKNMNQSDSGPQRHSTPGQPASYPQDLSEQHGLFNYFHSKFFRRH